MHMSSRIIIIAILVLFSGLTAAFFLLSGKPNTQNACLFVATEAGVLAVLWTVVEMKAAREQQHRPNISFGSASFWLRVRGGASVWSDERVEEPVERGRADRDFMLPATNIGNGVAKDIDATWHFNISDFVTRTGSYPKAGHCNLIPAGEAAFIILECGSAICVAPEKEPHRYLHIGANSSGGFHFPEGYLDLLGFYLYTAARAGEVALSSSDIPPLEGTIRYKDISGKSYGIQVEVKVFVKIDRYTGIDWQKGTTDVKEACRTADAVELSGMFDVQRIHRKGWRTERRSSLRKPPDSVLYG